jgi:hypothetical protein
MIFLDRLLIVTLTLILILTLTLSLTGWGNRVATLIVYLNDLPGSITGCTNFKDLDLKVLELGLELDLGLGLEVGLGLGLRLDMLRQ